MSIKISKYLDDTIELSLIILKKIKLDYNIRKYTDKFLDTISLNNISSDTILKDIFNDFFSLTIIGYNEYDTQLNNRFDQDLDFEFSIRNFQINKTTDTIFLSIKQINKNDLVEYTSYIKDIDLFVSDKEKYIRYAICNIMIDKFIYIQVSSPSNKYKEKIINIISIFELEKIKILNVNE